MPRLAGIDIPEKKKIRYALRYIYGIGPKFERCSRVQHRPGEAGERTLRTGVSIAAVIDENYIVEGAPASVAAEHPRLRDIRSYRGDRHRRGLPVRGQRTSAMPVPGRAGRRRRRQEGIGVDPRGIEPLVRFLPTVGEGTADSEEGRGQIWPRRRFEEHRQGDCPRQRHVQQHDHHDRGPER